MYNKIIRLWKLIERENYLNKKKTRIRETKDLSTNANSSIDTTVGWTKNNLKNGFFFYGKNYPKRENSKMSRNMQKLAIRPSTRGL